MVGKPGFSRTDQGRGFTYRIPRLVFSTRDCRRSPGKEGFSDYPPNDARRLFQSQARADEPLLSATQHNLIYRKGPLALYALREYIGRDKIRMALQDFFKENAYGKAPLPLPSDL